MKTTIILGAGFSKNSGIPVQAEIPGLLTISSGMDPFDDYAAEVLKKFLKDIFGFSEGFTIPNLDDIFTCIDISTNSGHHLGLEYTPVKLRAIRRILVYKVFKVLQDSFTENTDVLEFIRLFTAGGEKNAFVVLNWDTVVEKYIRKIDLNNCIDYCNAGIPWNAVKRYDSEKTNRVIKIHGSDNWLYCDNCRALFHDMENEIPIIKKAGFTENDLNLMENSGNRFNREYICSEIPCRVCGNGVSSHIATLSYRKTFRANSFPDIWKQGEKELAESDRWIFVGYSLPDSDYEFKHMLKIAELKLRHVRKESLKIDVILLNSTDTIHKYRNLFGTSIGRIFNGGIREYLDFTAREKSLID